ncbi:autotransporter outer membrane beta-barrel domain-containing protein [Bradyrhizobium sp. UFLA05-109]
MVTTNSGATTFFQTNGSGGQARFITNAGGTFDISGLTNGGTTAGSIEGAGNYVLGTNTLTVGGNGLSTEVSGVISGSGGSLVKVGTGTLTLSGANTYSGDTTIRGGTLAAGAVNAFSAASHTVVETGGTLALQGFNQTLNNGLENAGTVQLGVPGVTAPGTTLTVAGNYVGGNGILALNSFLGTDGSPSDRLIINGGTATGSTGILVTNVGGPGMLTTANGILVVNAINGATTPGAFTLANPELRAGAYDYHLFQGSPPTINDPTVANDWFLRSTFIDTGPTEPIGPNPPPEPMPPGVWPIIGPELATYGVVQPIARQMGLTTLGTFHERVGDASADAACLNADPTGGAAITKAPPVANCRQMVWGRLFGQQIDNHYQAFADPRASGQLAGIQAGADLWRGSLIPGQSDTVGLYFAYGNGNVGVNGLVTNAAATAYILEHTGSVNLNAYSVGGYWTHYGPGGWYIDVVLQGSFYNGNAATQFANLPISGTGFTSSLETGYPIPLPWLGPGFVLEPEGQIIWQRVSFDDDNDGLGPVALGTTSGASGRLGLRGKWTINDAAGRVWQPYVLANVWRDWGGNATTTFGIDPVPLLEQATRLEFAGGLSAKIIPGLSLYAQAGYQFAVSGTDGGKRDGVKGNFGVRYSW